MSSYRMSNGDYISKKQLDGRVERAKNEYTELVASLLHIDPNYIKCERCERRFMQNTEVEFEFCKRVSRSHIISVSECQRSGRAELAYDILNFEHLGEPCHSALESNKNDLREAWYNYRSKGILEQNEFFTFEDFLKEYNGK